MIDSFKTVLVGMMIVIFETALVSMMIDIFKTALVKLMIDVFVTVLISMMIDNFRTVFVSMTIDIFMIVVKKKNLINHDDDQHLQNNQYTHMASSTDPSGALGMTGSQVSPAPVSPWNPGSNPNTMMANPGNTFSQPANSTPNSILKKSASEEFQETSAAYTSQFFALYMKSFYMIRNNPGLLFSLFFWPVFFVLMLEGLHQFQSKPLDLVNFDETVGKGGGSDGNELGSVYPGCKYWDRAGKEMKVLEDLHPCMNLLWGSGATTSSNTNNFATPDTVISMLKSINPSLKIKKIQTEDQIFREIYRNPGKYDASIWFSSERKYRLWVNQTAALFYERNG